MRISDWSSDVCSSDLVVFVSRQSCSSVSTLLFLFCLNSSFSEFRLKPIYLWPTRREPPRVPSSSLAFGFPDCCASAPLPSCPPAPTRSAVAVGKNERSRYLDERKIGRAPCRERVCQTV